MRKRKLFAIYFGKNYQKTTNSAIKIGSAIFFILLLVFEVAFAKPIGFSSDVKPKIISLGDSANLEISLSGELRKVRKILPPKIDSLIKNFSISYLGSSEISEGLRIWRYLLTPKKIGTFSLQSMDFSHNGKNYQTNPIELKVIAANRSNWRSRTLPIDGKQNGFYSKKNYLNSLPNSFSNPFYGGTHKVEAWINNSRPYVNEQVTYTFRHIYTAEIPNVSPLELSLPGSMANFLDRKLQRPPMQQEMIEAVKFRIEEIPKAFFPLQAGAVAIPPTLLRIPKPPSSLAIDVPTQLSTRETWIDVRPLPSEGMPANFNGAVGEYKIKSQVNFRSVELGSGIGLSLEISGFGNIETIVRPTLPPISGVKVYKEAEKIGGLSEVNGKIFGSKIYRYLLVPSNSDTMKIPAIQFSYFDPKIEKYRTVETVPIPIYVSEKIVPIDEKSVTASFSFKSEIHWLMAFALVIASIVAMLFFRRNEPRNALFNGRLSSKQTVNQALQSIERLTSEADEELTKTPKEIVEIIFRCASELYEISPIDLNPESIGNLSHSRGISMSVAKELTELLKSCNDIRFSPISPDRNELAKITVRAKNVLSSLENEV